MGQLAGRFVHLETCVSYVNRKAKSRHSRWYGPFPTIVEAFDAARTTGCATIRDGQCCSRQSAVNE